VPIPAQPAGTLPAEAGDLELGNTWALQLLVSDENDILANAGAVAISITGPDNVKVVDAAPVTPTTVGTYDRDYTPAAVGWWRADWVATGVNAGGHTEWVYVRASQPWVPSPAQVHALIPTRPVFTDTSRPTLGEVQAIINLSADSVASESPTGTFLPANAGKVRLTIALFVAQQVEASFWPEQQTGPDSPAELLYARYQGELTGLRGRLLGDTDPVVA